VEVSRTIVVNIGHTSWNKFHVKLVMKSEELTFYADFPKMYEISDLFKNGLGDLEVTDQCSHSRLI